MALIYFLYDSRWPNKPRYVGYTKHSLEFRLKYHMKDARLGGCTHKCNWMRSVLSDGANVNIRALEETNSYNEREIFWISELRRLGHKLVNGSSGGDGSSGHVVSEQTKLRLSEINKGQGFGRKLSEATKLKIAKSKLGKKLSEEHRAKLKKTSEARLKISLAHKGKTLSAEHREKIRNTLRAKPITERHLKQLEAAREVYRQNKALAG